MNKTIEKKFKEIAPLSSIKESVATSLHMLKFLGERKFIDILIRNENLIVDDGSEAKATWVVDYLESLHDAIESDISSYVADYVYENIAIVILVNSYFAKLIEWRSMTDAVKTMSPASIVSAALVRGVEEYLLIFEKLKEEIDKATEGKKLLDAQRSYLIEDSRGMKCHPDTALLNIFNSIFLVLKSTAFIEKLKKGKSFDFQDFVPPSENDLFKIAALNFNAMSWSYFDDLQKDIRHCGRNWRYFGDDRHVPEAYKGFIEEHLDIAAPSDWKSYEIIAEQRVRNFAREVFYGATQFFKENPGLEFAKINKLASTHVIEKVLSLDAKDERSKCLGLTLSQWLEGYSALQGCFENTYTEENKSLLIPFFTRSEIIDILVKGGLKSGLAEIFLDNVTFGPSSYDLYDTPVIKFGDVYMIYGPALKNAMLHELVISNVSRNKVKLQSKGRALEENLFRVMEQAGLKPRYIKEKRNGKEYEFDVVVLWDNVLFVFECKNRAIPKSPILSRNMMDDYVGHAEQLHRLCDALKIYPDIVNKYFGKDCYIEKIVPCIVNGMPFSLDCDFEGVFVSDMVSISRFFDSGEVVFLSTDDSPHGSEAVFSIWGSDAPSVNDFLYYLSQPFQVVLGLHNCHPSQDSFMVGSKSCVRVDEVFYEDKGIEDAMVQFKLLTQLREEFEAS